MEKDKSKLEKARVRLEELYAEAEDRYLDKSNWDMFDWMTAEAIEEYEKLQKILGEK